MVHESGFIFDIFLRRKLSPLYTNPVFNKITQKELNPIPNQKSHLVGVNFLMERDRPDYLEANPIDYLSEFEVKRIKQYQGFACVLEGYEEVTEYLKDNFGKSSIKNIKARKRQLETRFSTSYQFYFGEIDKNHYDFLFDRFYEMLKRRFDEKKIYNRYLLDWKHYYEMVYPMVLSKEACLFVIYVNDEPISISLEFCFDDICYGYIHGYDSNYHRYQLGDIRMVKLLEWLIANNYKMFDTLMGETVFKAKWANTTYDFYYDLYYLPKSITSQIKFLITKFKLGSKQFLRDKGILGKLVSLDKWNYRKMAKKLNGFDWKDTNRR